MSPPIPHVKVCCGSSHGLDSQQSSLKPDRVSEAYMRWFQEEQEAHLRRMAAIDREHRQMMLLVLIVVIVSVLAIVVAAVWGAPRKDTAPGGDLSVVVGGMEKQQSGKAAKQQMAGVGR